MVGIVDTPPGCPRCAKLIDGIGKSARIATRLNDRLIALQKVVTEQESELNALRAKVAQAAKEAV